MVIPVAIAVGVATVGVLLQQEQNNRFARNDAERQGNAAKDNVEQKATEAEIKVLAGIEEERIRKENELNQQRIQVELQGEITTACRAGNLERVPTCLRSLDDNHFLALGNLPVAEAMDEDTLMQLMHMLIAEQERRFPNNGEV